MAELKFQRLTPTSEVDLSGYEEAMEYVFSKPDIRNIAISGAYSSGKSSVIESYKKRYSDRSFLHISLAHFRSLDSSDDDQETPVNISENDNQETVIEGKILNQLIQQIPSNNIPQTNFQIKRDVEKRSVVLLTVGILMFIVALFRIIKAEMWDNLVFGMNDGCVKNLLSYTTGTSNTVICGLVLFILAGVAIYWVVYIQRSRNIVRKVSLKGNEIEIFSESSDSYFDKYLNEVLYLFENTNMDGIVFEDIDRFENTTIFERLREINTLTNIRLKNKKRKVLRFFYLLRDDIFENKDRTKFFDFILPVVPVLDSNNSYNKLKDYLEEAGIYSRFDDRFLRGLCLYIDDLRVLKNIYNEFLVYEEKLNNIDLDPNKLLAIITYKNIFPRDFADLQLNKGFIYALFDSRPTLISKHVQKFEAELEEINSRFQACENEVAESMKELEYIKEKRYEADGRYRYSDNYIAYQNWEKNDYPKRKRAIEDKAETKQEELNNQKVKLEQRISEITNLSMKQLLSRDFIDEAFRITITNEVNHSEEFISIKGSHYFPLLKYLISRGYIDETYSDYMSFFYPNSLTLNDKVFLRSVTDRNAKPHEYHLDSPALVTDNLNVFDFTQREALNFDLSEYIVRSGLELFIKALVSQLESDRRFDYIESYIDSGHSQIPFVMAIEKYWPGMMHTVITQTVLHNDTVKLFTRIMIANADQIMLKEANIDNCFTSYISNDPTYLSYECDDVGSVIKSLILLDVRFKKIDAKTTNRALFDQVYEHNLYEINASNIYLMLREKYGARDMDSEISCLFTLLTSVNPAAPMSTYLWNHVSESIKVYLSMPVEKIQDDCEAALKVLNNTDIELDDRLAYIRKLETKIQDIIKITDEDVQEAAISNYVAEYNVHNILAYFDKHGLSAELVDFINSKSHLLDYLHEGQEDSTDRFLDAAIKKNAISDVQYENIIQNLCAADETFNISGLDDSKVLILIKLNILPMTATNLKFIRGAYPTVIYDYIQHDVEGYLVLANGTMFNCEEMLQLLDWEEIDDSKKIQLLERTSNAISLKNKHYSEQIGLFILKHNLDTDDIPWMIENYRNTSNVMQDAIIDVLRSHMAIVCENAALISDDLLLDIIKESRIMLDNKTALLSKVAKRLPKDMLDNVLRELGADKIIDNLNGGNKYVDATEANKQILTVLYEASIINKFELQNDGKHYKKIRRRAPMEVVNSKATHLL